MPQDFAPSTEIGGFASTVSAPLIAPEAPVVQESKPAVVEKPVVEETKPLIEKPADDQHTNPNLGDKPVAKVEDEDAIPAGMTKPAQETWKKIKASEKQARAERDEAKKEAETIRGELAESGKTKTERDALKTELKAAKARITEYDQEISVHRVEMSGPFKKSITAPLKEINDSAGEMAKRYEIAPETILRAIQEADAAKRVDLLEDVSTDFKSVDRYDLVQSAKDYHRIQRQAEEMRQNASKTLEEMTRQEKEASDKASTQTVADYRRAVGNEWKSMQETIPELRGVAGNDKWNAYLDSIQRDAEAIDVNDLPVSEVAKMAASHKAMPEVLSVLKHFKSEAAKWKAEAQAQKERVSGIRKSTPGAGSGDSTNGTSTKKDTRNFASAVFSKEE
jgi:hypothetical protein